MTERSAVADKAIQKILAEYQKLADQERDLAPKREAAGQKIEALVNELAAIQPFDGEKVTVDMMAAFNLFQRQIMMSMQMGDMSAQMKMARFDENFMEGLKAKFDELKTDPQKLQDVRAAAQAFAKDMQPSQIQINVPNVVTAIDEPEGDFGTWTVAILPMIIDENYQAKMADKLDFDLYLSAQVTPSQTLSGAFNVPGQLTKAGDKVEPFIITHTTAEDGPETVLHLNGHIYKDGAYQQSLPFQPLLLAKEDPSAGMDMQAILQALMGGGGPGRHGPN